jgi:hypothetical protein
MMRFLVRRAARPLVALALLAACSDSTAPVDGLLEAREISLEEMGQRMGGAAAARVEITMRETGVVAQRIVIKTGDELAEPEIVAGSVTGIAVEGDQGTLTLALGLQITFDVETEFGGREGDGIGFEDFVASVTEALTLGREPRIQAARRPADQPQAPDDPAFHATALRLMDEHAGARLVLNVDRDNLTIVDQPPPDAILTVLGLAVEIRVSEGLTELILDQDRRHEVAFEGLVRAVRLDAGTFVLVHGDREVVVRVLDRTRLALNGDAIESLEPIARALEAGLTVKAVGEGVVGDDSHTVFAMVVRFMTREGPEEVRFGGRVREVDVERGLVAIVEGPVVRVGDDTRLAINGEPVETLARVAAALEAGHVVHAFGEGWAEAGSDVVLAAFIRFEIDHEDTPDQVAFAGRVASVQLDAGTFVLMDGPTIQVTDQTAFADMSAAHTLGAVAEALAQGFAVYAEGRGLVVSTEPRVIAASVVAFRIED